jgi:hypothetical protein
MNGKGEMPKVMGGVLSPGCPFRLGFDRPKLDMLSTLLLLSSAM